MFFLALGATCIATVFDLRARRIPNFIPASLLLCTVIVAATGKHPLGWEQSILGLVFAVLIALPAFAKGWLGGGDAKLLFALGATLGLMPFLAFLATSSVAGGFLALRARGSEATEIAYAPAMLLGLLALLPLLWLN